MFLHRYPSESQTADWNDVCDNRAFFTLVQARIYVYTYTSATRNIYHTNKNGRCLSRKFYCG